MKTQLPQKFTEMHPTWVVAAVALCLYARTIGFSFLDWDDLIFIVNNPVLAHVSFENLGRILTPGGIDGEWLYVPVTYLSYFAESAIFGGPNSQSAHMINAVLHALNGMLVLRLARRLKLGLPAAIAAAILFVVHPLQVEAVAWAMGRKDLLATLACLIAIECWQRDTTRAPWFAAVAVGVAVLAKPTAVILPAILVLMDWHQHALTKKRLVQLLPSIVGAVVLLIVNLRLGSGIGGMDLSRNAGRLWHLPWAICDFLQRFLLLQPPDFLYLPHRLTPDTISISVYLACLVIIATVYIAYRTNQRRFLFGILFAVITAAPIANVFFASKIFITADRYTYLPLVGITIAMASLPLRRFSWIPAILL